MRANLLRWGMAIGALAGWLLAGCSNKRDVGDPCTVQVPQSGSSTAPADACNVKGDWLETGVVGCENLVCVLSPAKSDTCDSPLKNGVCSKPCVADSDCFPDETGLGCRQVVLDSSFMIELEKTPDGLALLDKYLGDIRLSSYCAFPLPNQ